MSSQEFFFFNFTCATQVLHYTHTNHFVFIYLPFKLSWELSLQSGYLFTYYIYIMFFSLESEICIHNVRTQQVVIWGLKYKQCQKKSNHFSFTYSRCRLGQYKLGICFSHKLDCMENIYIAIIQLYNNCIPNWKHYYLTSKQSLLLAV